MILIKRVYEPYSKEDGYRILVDRLWPRGMSKGETHLDIWLKEIAPTTELRKWFGHDPEKWEAFKKRYRKELKDKTELIQQIKDLEKKYKQVTLLYGARDTEHNEAKVLQEVIQ